MSTNLTLTQLSSILKGFSIDPSSVLNTLRSGDANVSIDEKISAWITDNIDSLMETTKNYIVNTLKDDLSEGYFIDVISPVTEWISDNVEDLIVPNLQTWLTDTFLATIIPKLNTSPIMSSVLTNVINPFLKLLPFKEYIYLSFEDNKLKVNSSSLFADGYFYIGNIVYDIIRRLINAFLQVMRNTGDFFNDHVSGTTIDFPLPFFSLKGIHIATKVENMWVPNEDLELNKITDFATLIATYPIYDIWPLNVKLPDATLVSNGILAYSEDNKVWSAGVYKKYDLVYDIICLLILSVFIYFISKAGFHKHKDKVIDEFVKNIPNSDVAVLVNNTTKYNKSLLVSILTLAATTMKSSSTNFASLLAILQSISGLSSFSDLFAEETGDSLDDDIYNLLQTVSKDVKSSYRPYG